MTDSVTIRIQESRFRHCTRDRFAFAGRNDIGAVVTFTGVCRGSEGRR